MSSIPHRHAVWSPYGKDRARQVFDKLTRIKDPYLVTGHYATYQYHRWRFPVEGLVTLKVYEEDTEKWREHLREARVFLSSNPPYHSELENGQPLVVLKQDLEPSLYDHRRVIEEVNYQSPEDVCLELLHTSRNELSIGEAMAILVRRRKDLDWQYVYQKAAALSLARELGILLDIINHEAGRTVMPPEVINHLFEQAKREETPRSVEGQYYPFHWKVKFAIRDNKLDTLVLPYPEISEKWGLKVALPRHVAQKILLDLHP